MDMNFDVKAKIEELVEKLQKDPALLKRFQSDPIQTVEGLLGVDKELWAEEAKGIREYYAKFGDKLPKELLQQLDTLENNLKK